MDELKPCPLCNGQAKLCHGLPSTQNHGTYQSFVRCKKCGCKTKTFFQAAYESKADVDKAAKDSWNLRVARENKTLKEQLAIKSEQLESLRTIFYEATGSVPSRYPGNNPLTLEQLQKMQKQYVWIVDSDPDMTFSGWAVCDGKAVYYLYFNKGCPIGSASIDLDDGYDKTWLAYSRKPEGSEKA